MLDESAVEKCSKSENTCLYTVSLRRNNLSFIV